MCRKAFPRVWSSSPMTNVREVGGPVPRSSNWTGAGLIFTSLTDIVCIIGLFGVDVSISIVCFLSS